MATRSTYAVVVLVLIGCLSCAAPIGDVKYADARQFIHPRVEVDGFVLRTDVSVHAWKSDQPYVTLSTWDDFLLGGKQLIARDPKEPPPAPIMPGDWSFGHRPETVKLERPGFELFVPLGRLVGVKKTRKCTLAIHANTLPDSLLESRTIDVPERFVRPVVWSNLETHENREHAFHAKLWVFFTGLKERQLTIVGVVRRADYSEFGAREGGPFRFEIKPVSIEQNTDKSLVDLWIPYDAFASLAPAAELILTPSVVMDGRLILGNVHYHFAADRGSQVIEREAAQRYRTMVEEIERRIKATGQSH